MPCQTVTVPEFNPERKETPRTSGRGRQLRRLYFPMRSYLRLAIRRRRREIASLTPKPTAKPNASTSTKSNMGNPRISCPVCIITPEVDVPCEIGSASTEIR
jgi:hypothetical protein